jgi:benzoylformate decarboxylase
LRSRRAAGRLPLRRRTRLSCRSGAQRIGGLLHAIGEALPEDAVVVEEALSSGPGLRQLVRSDDPRSFFGMRGGGIGWGLSAAVGVKLAQPDRPVVALVGDGSAMYTCQALWTAARERLGIVFVILNNGSYRILKQRTQALRGHAAQTGIYVGMDLADPPIDFLALARTFGIRGERAQSVEAAVEALRGGLAEGGPVLIDVELDRSF